MKIAMIGQKGIPAKEGGIERHVEELSAALAMRGHEVLVFCRSWYVWPIRDYRGVRCIKTPSLCTKHLDTITHTFFSILGAARENVDIFHFHGVGPALLSWLPKLLRPSAKVIVTFHCIDRHHQKWGLGARLALRIGERMACVIPHATITVSKTLETYCRMSYGTNSTYIPNGTHIVQDPVDSVPLNDFQLKANSYLLFCARLVKHKGAHLLIEAWKQLQQQEPHCLQGKKLVIVGGSVFTNVYVSELHRLAEQEPSIVFTGIQTGETLKSLFAHCYALVHPSESEGLSLTILEAMGYGKCVLSSDIPENLELTAVHGLTFEHGNVNDLAKKIIELFQKSEQMERIGKSAQSFIALSYDWKNIAETTEYLYELVALQGKTLVRDMTSS